MGPLGALGALGALGPLGALGMEERRAAQSRAAATQASPLPHHRETGTTWGHASAMEKSGPLLESHRDKEHRT
jgi:hypothetical protein